ncbi:MAG: glycosyltransferase [Owenweeksia sp.]
MKTKVLFVIRQMGSTGGVERRALQLQEASLNSEFEIEIFSFLGKLETYDQQNVSRLDYFKRLARLCRKISSYKPKVIHAFDLESGIYCAVALKMLPLRKVKFISGYGAEYITDSRIKKLLGYSFFRPQLFICNSRNGAASLKEHTHDQVPVKTISNGISLPEPEMKSTPEWSNGREFIIGCISKFDPYKRADRVFDLVDHLPHDISYRFVVVGTGKDYDKAIERCNRSELYREKVTLLGVVPDAWQMIPWFDIGILVSDSEGFPTVLLEYMQFEKPVVATKVGETNLILNKGEAGIVSGEWDVKEFAGHLASLMNDDEMRKNLAARARKRFEQNFTFEKMKNKYFANYRPA